MFSVPGLTTVVGSAFYNTGIPMPILSFSLLVLFLVFIFIFLNNRHCSDPIFSEFASVLSIYIRFPTLQRVELLDHHTLYSFLTVLPL